MHGLGNDFIMIQGEWDDPRYGALAVPLCDRFTGIGADGIIVYGLGREADLYMRIYNSDGSEAKMCGNATRCLGKLAYESGLVKKEIITVDTQGGRKALELRVEDGVVYSVRVNMGVPILECARIPALCDAPRFVDMPYTASGMEVRGTLVNMGNPHSVVFLEDIAALDLGAIGPGFERHPMFPDRINTEFVQVEPDGSLTMRVYERGAGETMACGTGACAVMVAARLLQKVGNTARIHLTKGDLLLSWAGEGEPVYMEGPAAWVYDGILREESR